MGYIFGLIKEILFRAAIAVMIRELEKINVEINENVVKFEVKKTAINHQTMRKLENGQKTKTYT